MSSIAIIGANGFIGSHVVGRFVRAGWRVVAACRAGSDRTRLAACADFITCIDTDIQDIAHAALWDAKPDVLINCSGYGVNPREADPAIAARVNALAVAELIAAASCVQRILHLGSAAEYMHSHEPILETGATVHAGMYGTSKLAGTLIALQAAHAYRRDVCVIRPFGCYGEGESAGKLLPLLLSAIKERRKAAFTSGTQVRDYIYVGDLAEALFRLATVQAGVAGEIFNVCSGIPLMIRQLGEALLDCARAPAGLADWGALPQRTHDPGWLVGDCSKIGRAAGWSAQTTLGAGMKALLSANGLVL